MNLTDGVYHDNLVFGYDAQRAPPTQQTMLAHTGHWKHRLQEVHHDVEYVEMLIAKHGSKGDHYRTYPGEVPPRALPVIEHTPVAQAVAGKPLELIARVTGGGQLRDVLLHYRPLDQTADWQTVSMRPSKADQFTVTVPGEAISFRYDLMYYLEARVRGGGTLWPDWQERQPYVVVRTIEPQ